MLCNVLQPPSTLHSPVFHLSLLLPPPHLSPSCPLHRLLPPRRSSDSTPSWRCSIEIQFPPAHPSHLSTFNPLALSLVVLFSTSSSSSPSSSISPITPPRLPHYSGDPQHPGKEATGCIPRDKLRSSIIHRNLQVPLFKRHFLTVPWPLHVGHKHEDGWF